MYASRLCIRYHLYPPTMRQKDYPKPDNPKKRKVVKSPKDKRRKLEIFEIFKSKKLKIKNRRKKTPLKTKTAQPIQTKEKYYGQMCVYPPLFPSDNDKRKKRPAPPVVVYTKATTGLNETKGFCTTARAFGAAGISTG